MDIWNAYELSWLDARGKPQFAIATFTIPADSPHIIESKSFKLYLNSYNQTRLDDARTFSERVAADLSAAAGAPVGMDLILPPRFSELAIAELDGEYLDGLAVAIDTYTPDCGLLRCAPGEPVPETQAFRLLQSNR